MQIHFLSNVIFGGGEQVMNTISKNLPNKCKVFFLRKSNHKYISSNINFISNIKAKHSYSILDQFINLIICLKNIKKFNEIISKNDLFIFHGMPLQIITFIFSFLYKNKKFHFVFHGIKKNNFFKKNTFAIIEKFLLSNDNIKIYGVSDKSVNALTEYFNTKIYRFINSYEKINTKKDLIVNKKYDEYKFIYVARFDKLKRHDRLIKLFQEKYSNLNYTMTCIGEGPEINKIKNLTKKYNLTKFKFPGLIDRSKLDEFYLKSHAILFPAEIESFGLSILESLEFNIPLFFWNEPPIKISNLFHISDLDYFLANPVNFQSKINYDTKYLDRFSYSETLNSIN